MHEKPPQAKQWTCQIVTARQRKSWRAPLGAERLQRNKCKSQVQPCSRSQQPTDLPGCVLVGNHNLNTAASNFLAGRERPEHRSRTSLLDTNPLGSAQEPEENGTWKPTCQVLRGCRQCQADATTPSPGQRGTAGCVLGPGRGRFSPCLGGGSGGGLHQLLSTGTSGRRSSRDGREAACEHTDWRDSKNRPKCIFLGAFPVAFGFLTVKTVARTLHSPGGDGVWVGITDWAVNRAWEKHVRRVRGKAGVPPQGAKRHRPPSPGSPSPIRTPGRGRPQSKFNKISTKPKMFREEDKTQAETPPEYGIGKKKANMLKKERK